MSTMPADNDKTPSSGATEVPLKGRHYQVWDLPIRAFHWLLVLGVLAAWLTGDVFDSLLNWHLIIGEGMLGLVVFRLVWGVIGSESARFVHFVRGPAAIKAYISEFWVDRRGGVWLGHNPLGALSVLAMLLSLSVQVGTGLFAAADDYINYGPLNKFVSDHTADLLTEIHEVNFNILLALIGLHLAAIAYYRLFKRENLVTPMVTGKREIQEHEQLRNQPTFFAGWVRFFVAVAIAVGVVWYVVTR